MGSTHKEMRAIRPPWLFWPLLGLGILLAAGSAVLLYCLIFRIDLSSDAPLFLSALPAALIAGIPVWWFFVVKPGQATIQRGSGVGVLGSTLAHPIMWILLMVHPLPQMVLVGMVWALPPFLIPLAALPWSLFSLIFAGWITAPIGAGAGALLILLQRTLTYYAPQQRQNRKAEANRKREIGLE